MFKLLANHRVTEVNVIVVTILVLGLLIILFGAQVNHLLFACLVSGFGLMMLIDILIMWKTVKDLVIKNKIKSLYIQADEILQGQLDIIHVRLKTIDEKLEAIEKRLSGVESNLDKLLKK
jgi:hypothetical protein